MKVYIGPYRKEYKLPQVLKKFLKLGERKVKIRIDRQDVWNMDHTLALIISPMLKKLKKIKHGSAIVDNQDLPEEFQDKDVHEKWDYVISEMIWSFEQILRTDRKRQFYSGEIDFSIDDENGLIYGPNDTFKIDHKSQKVYEDRIQNGLMLFGKYYQNLWD